MRYAVSVLALVVSGCAGQPPAAPPTRYVGNAAQGAQVELTALNLNTDRLVNAKKLGYTVVNTDGAPLFCKTEMKTGSHVQKETTCLTAQELDHLHDMTRQNLQNYIKPNPPTMTGGH
jgi:hypothetical protein